jgi:hypothetical protein
MLRSAALITILCGLLLLLLALVVGVRAKAADDRVKRGLYERAVERDARDLAKRQGKPVARVTGGHLQSCRDRGLSSRTCTPVAR